MASKWRALIVDDEPLARSRLRDLLQPHGEVQVIAECTNGMEAVDAIAELVPDFVLLDIQMPGFSGFDVVRSVGVATMPLTVFITAYDQYAVEAFELNATDYLLKPVSAERLGLTLERVVARLGNADAEQLPERFRRVLAAVGADAGPEHFVVRVGSNYNVVPVSEILWVEAKDNYVRLHTSETAHLMRGRISDIEAQLSTCGFARVHRSALVCLRAIRRISTTGKNTTLTLVNGASVLVSHRNRQEILSMLSGFDPAAQT
jgi:two-component system, LytTR family, response regulator